ncbi:MAG: DUF799 family lipoprotein [bacterium]|nr:DUF799 family lipoprotein [bacterium]
MRSRRRWRWGAAVLAAALVLAAGGCGSGASQFIRDDVDFSFIRRVAVYPFYNLSQDVYGGQRVQSVFLTELLERNEVEVLDRGEVLAAVAEMKLHPDAILSPQQVQSLGSRLKADAVFFATVEEYGTERSHANPTQVVTATYQLCEAQTGRVVWSSQIRTDGASLGRKLFGGGSASAFAVARENVRAALGTLF